MCISFVVAYLLPCFLCVSASSSAPDNEENGVGSGFAAIAKDLQELAHRDVGLKRNISEGLDNEAMLKAEKHHIHNELEGMKLEDERLHMKLARSKQSATHVQQKFKHSLAFIKNKYEADIKAVLPRLQMCSNRRDEVASELNIASAELYMAQQRLQQAREETNLTKTNWTGLVGNLAHAVDEDEQRIAALHGDIMKNENDTQTNILAINELHAEQQHLKQVIANASDRLHIAHAEEARLSASISREEHEGVELKKQSEDLGNKTKQLLRKIKDQVHVEQSSKMVADAASNASNIQQMQIQEIIATRKARIVVANAETEKAVKQLQEASDLLSKDRDIIARFQNDTTVETKKAEAKCKREIDKVKEDAGHRIAALQVALDEARHAEDAISKENHALMKQAEALKQQIAHSLIQFSS